MARVRLLRLDMIVTDCVCLILIQMAFAMSLRFLDVPIQELVIITSQRQIPDCVISVV